MINLKGQWMNSGVLSELEWFCFRRAITLDVFNLLKVNVKINWHVYCIHLMRLAIFCCNILFKKKKKKKKEPNHLSCDRLTFFFLSSEFIMDRNWHNTNQNSFFFNWIKMSLFVVLNLDFKMLIIWFFFKRILIKITS